MSGHERKGCIMKKVIGVPVGHEALRRVGTEHDKDRPRNSVVTVKVDRLTRRLIELTALAQGVTDSEYIRQCVRADIHRELVDGKGKSYWHVVDARIKALEAELEARRGGV